MSELITTYEYCTTCKKKHTMLDGGDIYDCWIQHRKDNPKDIPVEIWDMKKRVWVKRKD